MSSADAPEPDRSEIARTAARTRWVEHEGNPVLSRAYATVVTRAAELDAAQMAELAAALKAAGETDPP